MTTLGGDWSASDLKSLLAAKDFDLNALSQHYATFSPTWVAQDSAGFVAWTNEWNTLQASYAKARSDAETFLDVAAIEPAPDTEIDAQSHYNEILTSLNATALTNTAAPGSFDDLDKRLQVASGQATNYQGQPQPTPGTDQDLNLLNALPNPAKAAAAVPWWVWPGVGLALGGIIVAKVKEIF